jgi:hypothetical protein
VKTRDGRHAADVICFLDGLKKIKMEACYGAAAENPQR